MKELEAPKKEPRVFTLPNEHDWNTVPYKQMKQMLADVQESLEWGRKIYAHREGLEERPLEFCVVCGNELPKRVERGRFIYNPVYVEPKLDPKTGLYNRESICSQACFMQATIKGRFSRVHLATPMVPKEELERK
jgi:hypothetical protein